MEERIDRHIYQYVEAELRNYRTYKKLIEEYEKEYGGIKSALGGDGTGRFAENALTDPTSFEAVKAIANEHRISRQIDMVKCIEDVLQLLPDEDKRLIELRYFQGWLTDYGVSRELHVSLRTVSRRKRVIFKQLAIRMKLL